jgi:membrane protease YdiL (CAAX protease family)
MGLGPKTIVGAVFLALLLVLFVVIYIQFNAFSIYNQLFGTVPSLATIITYSVGLVLPLIAFARFMFNTEAGRYVSPLSGRFITSSIAFTLAIILVVAWYFIGIPILQNQITSGLYGILGPSHGC